MRHRTLFGKQSGQIRGLEPASQTASERGLCLSQHIILVLKLEIILRKKKTCQRLLLRDSKAPVSPYLCDRGEGLSIGSDGAPFEAFHILSFMIDLWFCWHLSTLHSSQSLQKIVISETDFNTSLIRGSKQLRGTPTSFSYKSLLLGTREETQGKKRANSTRPCLVQEARALRNAEKL